MICEELVRIPGPAGALEGQLVYEEDQVATFLALVASPHPLLGGTRDNSVVQAILHGVADAGGVALSWEYVLARTISSEADAVQRRAGFWENPAAISGFTAELAEAAACREWLRVGKFVPGTPPLLYAGYSYGGALALLSAPATSPVLAVSAPLDALPRELPVATRHQTLVLPSDDVAAPVEVVAAYLNAHKSEVRRVITIEGDDHFLLNSLDELRRIVGMWAGEALNPATHGKARAGGGGSTG